MSQNEIRIEEKTASSPYIKWGIFAAIVLVAFLAGLIPMLWQKWDVQKELGATQKQLSRSEIKGLLTSAIVEARRGEYEPARQYASGYFTRLRDEEEKSEDESILNAGERGKLKPVFDERDAVITMLAQRDPASVERLTKIYSAHLQALGAPPPPAFAAPPANTQASPQTPANTQAPPQTPATNAAP